MRTILIYQRETEKIEHEENCCLHGRETIRDKCTYEPCSKWGHKEENCWIKDPSKKANRNDGTNSSTGNKYSKSDKPKAFAAPAIIDVNKFDKVLADAVA